MKSSVEEVLETTQFIVPELDLGVQKVGNEMKFHVVPINCWHYYTNAIENASDLLVEMVRDLPDVEAVNDLETIAVDLNSLVSAFNIFYSYTMREVEKAAERLRQDLERIARYRNFLPRNRKTDKE